MSSIFFFSFTDTAPTEIYTLSLHDALPIFRGGGIRARRVGCRLPGRQGGLSSSGRALGWLSLDCRAIAIPMRSEEHTSELQSHVNLVCRLLLEKKKKLKSYVIRTYCY